MPVIFDPKYNSLPKQVDENKDKIAEMEGEFEAIDDVLNDVTDDIETLQTGKQEKLVSGTNIKTINGNSILGSGNLYIQDLTTDVKVDGTSITHNNVADLKTMNEDYNASTNKLATANDLQNDCVLKSGLSYRLYGTSNTGSDAVFEYDNGNTLDSGKFPRRSAGGFIKVPQNPSDDSYAASKKYVDDAVAGASGGLTELTLSDIYFSTFFSTYSDGIYILSAPNQTTQITIHWGVSDADTETIPWLNPNQKMILIVNNEYQNSAFMPGIKWKGITIITGGGNSCIYDARQRFNDESIHILNAVNNLTATIQDVASSKIEKIYGSIDLRTIGSMLSSHDTSIFQLKPAGTSDFVIYTDESTQSELQRLSYEEIDGALMQTYYNAGFNTMTLLITFGNQNVYLITASCDGTNLMDFTATSFVEFSKIHYKHDTTTYFVLESQDTQNSYGCAMSLNVNSTWYSSPFTTPNDFLGYITNLNVPNIPCHGKFLDSDGIVKDLIAFGLVEDYSDPNYPSGKQVVTYTFAQEIGSPVTAVQTSTTQIVYDLSIDGVYDHIVSGSMTDSTEQI